MAAKTKPETTKTVKLSSPILRGEQTFDEIAVNKPNVLALKGLTMLDVMQMNTDAMMQLLPRVTAPMLNKADFATMEVADFIELAATAVGFLAKNSEATATENAA